MLQCFATQNAHVYINSKQSSFLYKKIMKIPTQKGEQSCKCTELKRGNKLLRSLDKYICLRNSFFKLC